MWSSSLLPLFLPLIKICVRQWQISVHKPNPGFLFDVHIWFCLTDEVPRIRTFVVEMFIVHHEVQCGVDSLCPRLCSVDFPSSAVEALIMMREGKASCYSGMQAVLLFCIIFFIYTNTISPKISFCCAFISHLNNSNCGTTCHVL